MVRLILFDIDGTLIRTGGAGVRAFGKVFETEFGQTDHFERLRFAGRTDRSLVREFFSFHNIPATPDNFARFFERYAFWLDHMLRDGKTEVCAGVSEFIKAAQDSTPRRVLGLLSGNVRLGAELKLRRVGLWETFQTGAFADDHEDRNQIAAIARERGAQVLGGSLESREVLVVGDTPHDITCARAIGARVLAVGTGGASMEELRQHRPDFLTEKLSLLDPTSILEAP